MRADPFGTGALRTWGALVLVLAGCRTYEPTPHPPVDRETSARAHAAWERSRLPGDHPESELVDEVAFGTVSDWPVVSRHLDQHVHRAALTLPERYDAYLRAIEDGSPSAAYLAGRLGGPRGRRLLARSLELDPNLSWGWHGLAWQSNRDGRPSRAIEYERVAVDLARDPAELAHFSWALATYLRGDERPTAAVRVLSDALAQEGTLALRASERTFVEALLARIELESLDAEVERRGASRALDVIARPTASGAERAALVILLRSGKDDLVTQEEIDHAILAAAQSSEGAARDNVLELFDIVRAAGRLDAPGASASVTERLAYAFEHAFDGSLTSRLDAWLAELPSFMRADDGLPRRAELRAVVESALALDSRRGDSVARLGDALITAGWFEEADRLATAAIGTTGESLRPIARDLQLRAVRARSALASVRALARRIDARQAFERAGATGERGVESVEGDRISNLRELEAEIERILVRHELASTDELADSPRIKYGPIGAVLHPGPRFSDEDDRQGRGEAGADVPGISDLFRRLGRFALIGNGAGQGGPDVTVLRIVHVEERSGEHLGRPFRGTIFWCQGADVPGRFGRAGASISGAALHEGYYVDLSMVEREKARWDEVHGRFDGRPDAIRRALDVRGASAELTARDEILPALGAADRMRLAVMAEGGDALRRMSLGELARVVATHEEGHLCDRARWYPLTTQRILRVLSLGFAHWFDGGRIAQALEERAQLVALADAHDSRLAWIDLLDAAEGGAGGGVTPHGAAYRRVLGKLVARIEKLWERGELHGTALDPSVRWIDQLHRLDEPTLRRVARDVAKARDLVREQASD